MWVICAFMQTCVWFTANSFRQEQPKEDHFLPRFGKEFLPIWSTCSLFHAFPFFKRNMCFHSCLHGNSKRSTPCVQFQYGNLYFLTQGAKNSSWDQKAWSSLFWFICHHQKSSCGPTYATHGNICANLLLRMTSLDFSYT